MPASDNLGLIADWSIQQIGIRAREIETLLFRLPATDERAALVVIVEAMRDEEAKARGRIKRLAKAK